ncbi:hypothetical protein P7K49_036956 [Saguinus oedipus]|uniref:Uncharacterized protein n=1 Tax=Saguinus oedipus TaxID=9490 RepID=A0ABQ9TLV7_SAGOE|nr:hypothetical protein P7K49_036956 [Saguinus oedipus]
MQITTLEVTEQPHSLQLWQREVSLGEGGVAAHLSVYAALRTAATPAWESPHFLHAYCAQGIQAEPQGEWAPTQPMLPTHPLSAGHRSFPSGALSLHTQGSDRS